jgi:glycosyltransferase involved in cell wall biosynthesis
MRATVVVNNFNYERYVGAAIDSALAQTHDDVEVLVVDDGSTDGSRAVIEGYGEQIVALFKPNGGQNSAINAAIGVATGDFAVFLDADDLLAPLALERATALFADPGVTKVHWPLAEIDADGAPLGTVAPGVELPRGDLRAELLDDGPEAFVFPPTSGNAFSMALLRRELPLSEAPVAAGSASADAYLSMLAILRGRVEACDEVLGSYRIHGANAFAGRSLPTRLDYNLVGLEARFEALETRCRQLAIPVDAARWRSASWHHRLDATRRKLERVVAEGETFILIDQGEWSTDLVQSRRGLPLMEREGEWFGPPPDDRSAIAEVERLRERGARSAVIGWPAFWWLDHYVGLRDHLESRYRPVLRDDDLLVYDLETRPCG